MRSVPSHICKPPSEASLAHKLLHSYPHSLVNGPSDVPSTLSSLLLPPSQLFLFPFQRRPGVGSQRSLVLEPGGLGADRSGLTYGRGDLGGIRLSQICWAGMGKREHICWCGPRGPTRLGGSDRKTDFWLGEKLPQERSERGCVKGSCSWDSISDKTLRLFSFSLRSLD